MLDRWELYRVCKKKTFRFGQRARSFDIMNFENNAINNSDGHAGDAKCVVKVTGQKAKIAN